MGDPWDDPRARAWARQVERTTIPAIRDSDTIAPIWSGGEVDAKMSVEVGAAILMDKPLVLVVESGVQVPDKLVRVADRILEVDTSGPPDEWSAGLAERVEAAIREIDDEEAAGA